MSESNGVIRVGRKGKVKFAFGDDGKPFTVDVVIAWNGWVVVDDGFREQFENRDIPWANMAEYHQLALMYVKNLSGTQDSDINVAEALDFLARLREKYEEVAAFFRPKSRDEQELPAISATEHRFSAEES